MKNSGLTIFSLKAVLLNPSFISSCKFSLAVFITELNRNQVRTALKDICTTYLDLVKHSLLAASVTGLENAEAKKTQIMVFCFVRVLSKIFTVLLNTSWSSVIFLTWKIVFLLDETILKYWPSQCCLTRRDEKIKISFFHLRRKCILLPTLHLVISMLNPCPVCIPSACYLVISSGTCLMSSRQELCSAYIHTCCLEW